MDATTETVNVDNAPIHFISAKMETCKLIVLYFSPKALNAYCVIL